jgi:hypothetical protein
VSPNVGREHMGVRFHIRVQDVTDDWVDNGYGEPLAREYDRLERLLRKKGVRSLMEFYVPDPEEMVGHDKEEWFNAMEGLGIIGAMIRAAEEQKQRFADYARLREDLDDFRVVLDRAASLGKRWNLAMDT